MVTGPSAMTYLCGVVSPWEQRLKWPSASMPIILRESACTTTWTSPSVISAYRAVEFGVVLRAANLCLTDKVSEALDTLHSHDEADEIWLVYQSFEIVDEPAGFCDGRRQRRNQAANDVF